MHTIINDGGREAAGYKGTAGDCGVRAVAIATGKPYQEIYDRINKLAESERGRGRKKRKSSARTGVWRETLNKLLAEEGFRWVATMAIGSGCTVHMAEDELPDGILVCRLSKHYTTVINRQCHDTHDPTRDGTRCVYGYWFKEPVQ